MVKGESESEGHLAGRGSLPARVGGLVRVGPRDLPAPPPAPNPLRLGTGLNGQRARGGGSQEVSNAQGRYGATAASRAAPQRATSARDARFRAEPSRPTPAGTREATRKAPSPAARPTPRAVRSVERPGL